MASAAHHSRHEGTHGRDSFNGNNTVPPLGINPAYSGDRCLAFFAAYPTESGGGLILNKSDDYLISPLLSYHKGLQVQLQSQNL